MKRSVNVVAKASSKRFNTKGVLGASSRNPWFFLLVVLFLTISISLIIPTIKGAADNSSVNDHQESAAPIYNGTNEILVQLEYESGTSWDADNDGVDTSDSTIDLTIRNSQFTWEVNESNLCTRWQTYSIENDTSTTVCFGAEKCCNFISLEPLHNAWNETFYSFIGRYGTTENNELSAQIIYVDYSLEEDDLFTEVYYSEWDTLTASFIEPAQDIITRISELLITPMQAIRGTVFLIQARLVYENESPIEGSSLEFYGNNVLIGTQTTDIMGYASFEWNTTPVLPDNYLINAAFSGQQNTFDQQTVNILSSFDTSTVIILPLNESENKAPVWDSEEYRFIIKKNETLILDLDKYFFDENGDNMTYSVSLSENINILQNDSLVELRPDIGFVGLIILFIEATDNNLSTTQQITILVEEHENLPPVFLSNVENQVILKGSRKELNLSSYVMDPEDDYLTFSSTIPGNVNVTFNESIVRFVPTKEYTGIDSIMFIVNDSKNAAYSNNVTLFVLTGKKEVLFEITDHNRQKLGFTARFFKNEDLVKEVREEKVSKTGMHGASVSAFGRERVELDIDSYDFEITVDDIPLNKIRFEGLEFSGKVELGLSSFDKQEYDLGNKKILNAYSVDPTRIKFASASVSAIAKGTELFECEDWDFFGQTCIGDWKKARDLIPGEEYSIKLTDKSSGYVETGIATINTKKSVYRPGETAEMIMVVLDSAGYLVEEADLLLEVTAPDNSTTLYSSSHDTIIETEPGIYEASYAKTDLEGNYSLIVEAVGIDVNSTMISYFTVMRYYEFDILRSTPVTTDPWQGAFNSSIQLVSYVDTDSFDFSEILPIEFTVTESSGAFVTESGNKKILTWNDLENNSVITYSVLPPLVTPELYEMGPAQITYNSGVFTELRPWYLAVDPISVGSNYSVSMGHLAYETERDSNPPNPYEYTSEATGADYTAISTSNDALWDTALADANSEYDIHIFHFNISANVSRLTTLNFTWEGRSNEQRADYDLSAYCWNVGTTGWELIDTDSDGSTTDVWWTKEITSGFDSYVNQTESEKWVYMMARFEHYVASCPFVYSYNGTNWTFEHEAFPFSVIGALEERTHDRLAYLEEVDGDYRIQIREELNEVSFVDDFDFYVVDHKGDGFVMPDIDGNMHTIQNLTSPKLCYDKYNFDCLNNVLVRDGVFWRDDFYEVMDVDDKSTWENEVVLMFDRPKDAEHGKFFLNVMKQPIITSAWVYYIRSIGENNWWLWEKLMRIPFLSKLLRASIAEGVDLKVDVWTGEEWRPIGNIKAGRETMDDFLFSVDLSDIEGEKVNIRLISSTGFYEIDYVAMDYSVDEEMIVHEVIPYHAVFNNKTDVYSKIAREDGDYASFTTGDIIDLRYKAPEKTEDWNRDHAVSIKGYYNFIKYGNNSISGFVKGLFSPWMNSVVSPKSIPKIMYPHSGNSNTLRTDYAEVVVEYYSLLTMNLSAPPEDYTMYLYNNTPRNITYTCNLSSDVDVDSISLYLTDDKDSNYAYNDTCSVSGLGGTCSWLKNMSVGNYTWNCLGENIDGEIAWGSNRTLVLNYTYIDSPVVVIKAPNGTIGDHTPSLNITLDALVDTLWYNIDGRENTTICNNCMGDIVKFLVVNESSYIINVYSNNSIGNIRENSSSFNLSMSGTYYDDYDDNSSIAEYDGTIWSTGIVSFTGDVGVTSNGNFIAHSINLTSTIEEIIDITWSTSGTDTTNNISIEVSFDDGASWYNATNGEGIQDVYLTETLLYRVLFATDDSNTITLQDLSITWGDPAPPNIILVGPDNNTLSTIVDITFEYDVTDTSSEILNCTLDLNDGQIRQNNQSYVDESSTNSIDMSLFEAEFFWFIECTDSSLNNGSSEIRKLIIDYTDPTLDYELPTPEDNDFLNTSELVVNITHTELHPGTIELQINGLPNQSRTYEAGSNKFTNFSGLFEDGVYNFSVFINDTHANYDSLPNRTVTIDTTFPAMTYEIPTPSNESNQTQDNFIVNVSFIEENPDTILLFINEVLNETRYYSGNFTNFSLINLDEGAYNYYVVLNDSARNTNRSGEQVVNIDYTPASLFLENPPEEGYDNTGIPTFSYNVTDNFIGVENCSLIIEDLINQTNYSIQESATQNFSQPMENGTYEWGVQCYDYTDNLNVSKIRNLTVDTTLPVVSLESVNDSQTAINKQVCINATVTDTFSGVFEVLAEIDKPSSGLVNFTLENDSICDSAGGDVYAAVVDNNEEGNYTWIRTFAIDKASNQELVTPLEPTNWSAVSQVFISASMLEPTVNVTLNESDELLTYSFIQECQVFCSLSSTDPCEGVFIKSQLKDIVWEDITDISGYLTSNSSFFECGQIAIGASCNATFNLTSNMTSGDNDLPLRCHGNSTNAPIDFSADINVTINDHPSAAFAYPDDGIWLHGTEQLDASSSTDDRNLDLYTFEVDNNVGFDSSTEICSGSDETCMFDTESPGSCSEESLSCYLRLNLTDGDGLLNSTVITIGIDNIGPTSVLDRPLNGTNYTGSSHTINATVIDLGSGINFTNFSYRENDLSEWSPACSDLDGEAPFDCTWDISSLPDGNYYQIKVFSTDYEENPGANDTHYNITLDRTSPFIHLEKPLNDSWNLDDIIFFYNVSDEHSSISNCSLILDSVVNVTNKSITKNQSLNFSVDNLDEGNHTWRVRCVDFLGNENSSETRLIKVDVSGPVSTLVMPQNLSNISATAYSTNASSYDSVGIGVNSTTFWYRENDESEWQFICTNFTAPYLCNWDTGSLSEGTFYEIRVGTNDTLGNIGTNDTHTNITLDRTPAMINLESPENNTYDVFGHITFNYNASDALIDIANCSLIINGTINLTDTTISEDVTQSFQQDFENGTYLWGVNCTDLAGNINSSETRNLTVEPDMDPPWINLTFPTNNSIDSDGNVDFQFNVTDELSGIWNCSLIINGIFNKSNETAIAEGQINAITQTNFDTGQYNWSINCTDDSGDRNVGSSYAYNLTVQIASVIVVNLSSDQPSYERGEIANLSTTVKDEFDNDLDLDVIMDVIKGNTTIPWWDSSWKQRKPIMINSSSDQEDVLIEVNLSGLDGNIQSCNNEIRIIKTDGQFNIGSMRRSVTAGDDYNFCMVWFRANVTTGVDSTSFFAYYNNTNAESPGNTESRRIFSSVESGEAGGLIAFGAGYNVNSGSYSDTLSDNNVYYGVGRINGFIQNVDLGAYIRLNYSFPDLKITDQDVASLNFSITYCHSNDVAVPITCVGAMTGAPNNPVNAELYNFETSIWDTIGTFSQDGSSPNEQTKAFSEESSIDDYIDDDTLKVSIRYETDATMQATWGNEDGSFALDYATFEVFYYETINDTVSANGTMQELMLSEVDSTGPDGLWTYEWDTFNKSFTNYSAVSLAYGSGYGNETDYALFEILPDTTKPYTILNSPSNDSWNSTNDIEFYYTPADNSFHFSNCSLIIDDLINQTNTTPILYEQQNGFTVDDIYDGSYNWSINCTDYAENANKSEVWLLHIDTTFPLIELYNITEENDTYFNRDWIFVNVSIFDINEDNVTFFLFNSTDLVNETMLLVGNRSINFTELSNTNEEYYYNVTVKDKAGNSNSTLTRLLTLDSMWPTVEFGENIEENNSYFNRNWIYVNVSAYDLNEDNITFFLYNSTHLVDKETLPAGTRDYNFTGIADADEEYYYNVTVYDKAGNSNSTGILFITLDSTSPVVDFGDGTEDDNTYFNRDWINVTVTVFDTNEDNITFVLFNSTHIVNETTLLAGNRTINFTDLLDTNEEYYYNVSVLDKAGNNGTTATRTITLDSLVPTASLDMPSNDSWESSSSIDLSYTPYDVNPEACVLYHNASGEFVANETNSAVENGVQDTVTLEFDDGTYDWNVWCNDSAGNYAFNESNYTFNIDTVYPEIDFDIGTEDNDTFFNRDWIAVNVSIIEDNFNNLTFFLFNSTGVVNETTLLAGNTSFNFTGILDTNELYYYNVTARDKAGNANTTLTRVLTLDSMLPTVEFGFGTENNDTYFNRDWIYVNVSAYDGNEANITFFLFDSAYDLVNETTLLKGNRSFNFTGLLDTNEEYYYNVSVMDTAGTSNSTPVRKITLDSISPTINFTIPTPANETNQTAGTLTINVTHYDVNPDSVILFFDGSPTIRKYSTAFTNITLTDIDDGDYAYYVSINDSAGNSNMTEIWFVTVDSTPPFVDLEIPLNDTFTDNPEVVFRYQVSDDLLTIENCSLLIEGVINKTNHTVTKDVSQNFTQTFEDGNINWSVSCSDTLGNTNTSETRLVKVDTSFPQFTDPNLNTTNASIYEYVCLNITVTDTFSGVNTVTAQIELPSKDIQPVEMSDSATTLCDGENGNNVYSVEYAASQRGWHNWTFAVANDTAGNENSTLVGFSWNSTSVGSVTVNLTYPEDDIELNESEPDLNYTYEHACEAVCDLTKQNCSYVHIIAEYNVSLSSHITTTSQFLISNNDSYDCGNLTAGGDPCLYNFTIRSSLDAGDKSFRVRCKANSTDVGEYYSSESIVINTNDHPNATFTYPENGTILHAVEMLNASSSIDDQGLQNYTFELDDNPLFTSPTLLCNTQDLNCSFNTSDQSQCSQESYDCYLRLNVTDNDGLRNSTQIAVMIDNNGPTATLDLPSNLQNISENATVINATAVDLGIGVETLLFEYREDDEAVWQFICTNSTEPYECLANMTGLTDGQTYEFRVSANDTFGNIGDYDVHQNITINRTGPFAYMYLPRYMENISSETFEVNVTIEEIFTPVSEVRFDYRANDEDSFSFACEDTDGTEPFECTWTITGLSDGITYELRAIAKDIYGNGGAFDVSTNITIDMSSPAVNLEEPLDLDLNPSNLSFYYNTSDALRAVANCSLIINGTINQTDDSIAVGVTQQFDGLNFDEGQYNWSVNCTDDLGNENSSEFRTVVIDKLGPVSVLDLPSQMENISIDTFTVNASVTDAGIGVAHVTFEYREHHLSSWKEICNLSSPDYECTWDTGSLSEGTDYQVRVWANDTYRNVGDYDTHLNITIDRTVPFITLVIPENDSQDADGDDILFGYTVSDDLLEISNCSLSINGSVDIDYSITKDILQTFTFSGLEYGNHSWYVNCTDTAGNTNISNPRNIEIAGDTDPPLINLSYPTNGSTLGSNDVTFWYNVSDLLTDISSCTLVINDTINMTNESAIVENQLNSFDVNDVYDGRYRWYVNCTDTALTPNTGNSSVYEVNVIESTTIVVTLPSTRVTYERTAIEGEIVNVTTISTDKYSNPFPTNITSSIIVGNSTIPWWNLSYRYRKEINISNINNGTIIANYTINHSIETITLINESRLQETGADLRVIYLDDNTNYFMELNRILYNLNTTDTRVLFRTQNDIEIDNSNVRYYIYYGNSTVTDPPANKSEVYFHYDSFDTNTLSSYNTTRAFDDPDEDVDGTLTHDAAALTIDYTGTQDYGKSIRDESKSLTDVEIDVHQEFEQLPGTALTAEFELGARVTGDTYYFFKIQSQSFFNSEIGRYNEGSSTSLLTKKLSNYATGNTYHLKFIVYDVNTTTVNLRVYINDEEVMSVNDSDIGNRITAAGGFGTGSTQFIGSWDNLTVRRYIPDEPVTLTGEEEQIILMESGETSEAGIFNFTFNSLNLIYGNYSIVSLASRPPSYNNGIGFRFFNITTDLTPPAISLTSPENYFNTTDNTFNFNWTADDYVDSNITCNLTFDGIVNTSNIDSFDETLTNVTIGILPEGTILWNITCVDDSNNSNTSNMWNFTIVDSPDNVTVEIEDDNETVILAWEQKDYAAEYFVYVKDDFSSEFSSTPNVTTTEQSWQDTTANESTFRFYKISTNKGATNKSGDILMGKHGIELYDGWNMLSMSLNITNGTIDNGTNDGYDLAVKPVACIDAIWRYNESLENPWEQLTYEDSSWIPAGENSKNFTRFDSTGGYWVEVTGSCNLTIVGFVPEENVNTSLISGWNTVGWYSPNSSTLPINGDVAYPVDVEPTESVQAIDRYNALTDRFEVTMFFSGWGWWPAWDNQDFTSLEPGKGYYFDATESSIWKHDPNT
ncbi:MAG: hypothetical protein GY861_27135 [bacterium]|nr:hypothetical protein [bacterium]